MDNLGRLVVAVFTVVVGGTIVWLVVRECYLYAHGDSLLDARQFRFRLVGAGVLLGILAMMCAGVYVIHFTDALTFAVYWSVFALSCLVPVVMSIIDLRRVNRLRQEKQRALEREFVEFIQEQADLVRRNSQVEGPGSPADE